MDHWRGRVTIFLVHTVVVILKARPPQSRKTKLARVQLEKPVFSPTKKLHPHNLQKLSKGRYTYFSLGVFDDIPNGFDVALWP
jgi:hypothetical protein